MQRWLIGIAVLAGLALVAISLGMRAQVRGGAAVEVRRFHLRTEQRPGRTANKGPAAPSPLLTDGDLQARLRSLRGHPVVLNAWASWCPPCREELPLLSTASARFGRRVAFLGADVEDGTASGRRLLAEIPLGYPSYATSLDSLRSLGAAAGTPFTLFIDRKGDVVGRHIGAYRSQQELDADVTALVGPSLAASG
jgi:cytochrome c biogenesis protein CcmG/thiol:disulfide interchange protein DsbE